MISGSIRSNTNAASIELSGVRRDIRLFIEQYRQGRRETTDLVSTESLNTRKHVSLEAKRTNDAVGLVGQKVDRLVALEGAQIDERARARFLESLKYPGFNQRRSQIDDAYGDTLKWIFVGDNDEKSNDDSTSDEYDDFHEDYDSDEVYDSSSDQSDEVDEEGLSDQGHHSDHSNGPDRQHRPRNSFNTRTSRSASEASSSLVSDWGFTDSEEEVENRDHEAFWETKWNSFSNWLRSTDAIYWISGKPGSGKTTVVKYILADERTKKYLSTWCPGCAIVSHYFWLPGSPMQRNMEGLLCSLLYQLLESNLNALMEVMSSVSGSKFSHTDWSHAELHSSVVKALDFYKNGVCLFLDGIDEIKPEDGTKDGIPEFLDWAIELSQRSKIKLCLASRPDPHILETRLSRYPRLRLQDLNYEDLMTYAEGRVKIPEKDVAAENKDFIHSLASKAEGVFLWLILAIKSVNEGFRNEDSVETLRERIDSLPQGLDSLYRDMWARAGADNPLEYRQTAALYFKLLLASRILVVGEISAFDVMLATTGLADRVLDAVADPSKLVREDDMLQQYRRVEKKLNIYCVGLIQTVPDPRSRNTFYMQEMSACSWYGHVYDRIFDVAMRTDLEFVHRTARDFLSDTKSGREILGFDTSSELSIECRLRHAQLAKLALFTSFDSLARMWVDRLNQLFERWRHIGRELLQNWNRLASVCEQLAESGRLLAGDTPFAYRCNGTWFLIIASRHVGDDNRLAISMRIKNRTLSESEKSLFLVASMRVGHKDVQSLFRTCREVLRAGADPNWHVWLEWDHFPNVESGPRGMAQTPWQWLLCFSVEHLLHGTKMFPRNPALTTTDLTSLADVFLLFISKGARLNDPVNLAFTLDEHAFPDSEYKYRLVWVDLQFTLSHAILTSVPAYMIVKLLAKCLRRFCSISDTESFARVCDDLENVCVSHRSSGTCCVIGKLKEGIREPREFSWWETTKNVQTQLGSKVMECLEGLLLSTMPAIEGADISEAREVEAESSFQCTWNQMFDYIWDHKSWTLCIRASGMSSFFERLVELGVMVNLDGVVEFHSKEEWVRKHNLENPQYGGAI